MLSFSVSSTLHFLTLRLLHVTGAYRVKLADFSHSRGIIGKDKNAIYGRAFAAEMIKFDKDESNSTCHFDFAKESQYLEKMEVDSVAETPESNDGIFAKWLKGPLEALSKDYCKYF